MRNFIPLILSVLLGLAAVLAVGRLLAERKQAQERTSSVVAAARDIARGDTITQNAIMRKEVPQSAVPAQAIYWSRAELVVGQKALRAISQSDYLLLADVGLSRSMANVVGEGEWAVALSLPPGGMARVVQPGDEVAVVGTFNIRTQIKSADQSVADQTVMKEATLVLFPRVRVLDVGGATAGPGIQEGSEIILALPPQQAQVLIAAQRKAELRLALRRPDDEGTLNRLDAGMVDDATFDALLRGLLPVTVPEIPSAAGLPAAATVTP
jgi:Flp pilus assembly protein CpaB